MIITNNQAGPRGLHTTEGFVSVEPGASITADLTAEERASAEATGYFEFADSDADDLASLKLAELKDVAAAEGVDLGEATTKAAIADAIRAARAVKEG